VEEGLTVRRRKRTRLVRDRAAEPRLSRANQEWAMDFIVDGLATGRMVRILSVVDAYTRECLALEADTSLGSGRVTRVLERLIEERGRPEAMRSDNGPEFCSRRMLGWAEEFKIELVHIQPGRPMQNGHVESFHGRLRDECLNAHWFRTLRDVRSTTASAPIARSTIAHHKSSARYWKGAGPWPCSLPKPQPSTQPRISSHDWLRNRGQVTARPA
jgi:putative transposase